MVRVGDRVRVDGVEAVVECHWAAGRNMTYQLDDGRKVLDLHKKIEDGSAELISKQPADWRLPEVDPNKDEL